MYKFLFYLILALVVFLLGRYSKGPEYVPMPYPVVDTVPDTVQVAILKHDTIVRWINRWKYDTLPPESVLIVQRDTNTIQTCSNTVLLKKHKLKVYTNSAIYTYHLMNRYPELLITAGKTVHVREKKPLPSLTLRAFALRTWDGTLDIDAEAELRYKQVFIAVSTKQVRVGIQKTF